MNLPQLKNYLLSNRKRLALSQVDVAYLLGAKTGGRISRHERFQREPTLQTALAYEVIYKRAASELFSGLYRRIEQEIEARAKKLFLKIRCQKSNLRAVHRHKAIADIAGIEITKVLSHK